MELLVTFLPPDTTAPTVGITFPTDAQEAATTDAMANLSGEADDDRAVSRVVWTNSRGGSGEANGGRAWYVNDIALQPGLNVITVTVTDSAGNEESDALAVTFTPPPTVTPGAGANGSISPGAALTVNSGERGFFRDAGRGLCGGSMAGEWRAGAERGGRATR